mgnify:CR=1 FL=1
MASVFYYLFFLLFTILCFIPFALLYVLTVKFDREAGREKIDRGKAYVIVTNHQSMLDVPLMYVLPLNFKWVSKREVMRIPIFGWVLQMHGDIAIERGSSRSARHMMEEADDYLSRGTSVISRCRTAGSCGCRTLSVCRCWTRFRPKRLHPKAFAS